MTNPNRDLQQDYLIATIVLRLQLLSHEQCVEQIKSWRESADESFADWIASRKLIQNESLELIRKISDSLMGSGQDFSDLLGHLRLDDASETEISDLFDRVGEGLESRRLEPEDPTRSMRSVSTNRTMESDSFHQSGRLSEDTVTAGEFECGDGVHFRDVRFDAQRRYEVLRVHAEGGLGRVSVAHDRELGREVAFKQIKQEFVNDGASRRRFVLEAQVTGNLEHPGIVPVYSLASDDRGEPYYAMRLIQGESLRDAIGRFHGGESAPATSHSDDSTELATSARKTRKSNQSLALPFRQLLARFVDLCQAMDYAHSRGVIHRDLKPSNVMLGEFGETLVVDWGLARNLGEASDEMETVAAPNRSDDDATRPGTVVGTIAYMSPEQARGEVESLGPASDIFSLGSILFLILTGEKPFERFRGAEMLEAVRQGAYPTPGRVRLHVPRALEAVCLKAMAPLPADRYPTAGELADDIERWLADEPVSAWKEPLTVRTRRWMKSHRTLVATSVVTLVAATISLAIVLGVQADANNQLRLANTNERAAKEAAEADFRLAMNAINQYHNDVSANFLLRQSEFAELQNDLLAAPITFYTALASRLEEQEDPSRAQLEALFESYTDLAFLASKLGKQEQEQSAHSKALDVNAALIKQFPDDRQYKKARARLLLQVAENRVGTGELEKAKQAYDESQAIIREAAAKPATDEELAAVLAQAYSFYAKYCDARDDYDGVVASYEKAIQIRRQMVDNEPDNLDYLNDLALALVDFGLHYRDAGEPELSESLMVEGVELQQELILEKPDDMFATFRLAGSLSNLAYLWQDQEQFDDAIVAYESAEPAFRTLVSEAPNVVRFQSGLASTLNNRGLMHDALEQPELAEEAYLEALAIKERLAADFPFDISHQISLGGGYSNFAGFVLGTGNEEGAIEWYTKAIDTLQGVLDENPGVMQARFFFRQAHTNRGLTHHRLGNFLESAADYAVAIEYNIPSEPVAPLMRRRAHTLIKGRAYDEVMPIAITLLELAESDSDFYNIAVIHSVAIEAIHKDAEIDETEREASIAEHQARAIEALREMWATGVVPRNVFINLLENNEFLEGIRASAEFQQFADEFTDGDDEVDDDEAR